MTGPPTRSEPALNPVETAAVLVAAIAIALVGLVWAGATVSGRLVTGTAPDLGFGDAATAGLRIVEGDYTWAQTWPADQTDRMAGPVWFGAFVALEVMTLAVVVGVGLRAHNNTGRRRANRADDLSVRWATRRDIRGILTRRPDGRRLTLGTLGRRLVATEARHSVIVFGPTQSGKTTSLVIPALLEWRGPVVATSAKTDILTLTRGARAAMGGTTLLFDPTSSSVLTPEDPRYQPHITQSLPNSWSPLHAIEATHRRPGEPERNWRVRQWGAARESASWLVNAARTAQAGNSDTEFWYTTAEKLLAPLLFAAVVEGHTISDVVEWIDTQTKRHITTILDRTTIREARSAWDATQNHEERIRSASYTTLEVVMYAYSDPGVLALSQVTDIQPAQLLNGGPNTLFVVSPSNQQQRLRPLFTALVSEIIDTAFTMAANAPNGRIDPPLLVILDEAANIAPLQNLDQVASMGAGLGIQLVTAFQDLGQLQQVYGHHRATTVANNHRARILCGGVGDTDTLNYMSALIGDQLVETTSVSVDRRGGRSTTDNQQLRPLAPSASLRTIGDGQAVCVYGNLAPIRLHLRPWYRDKNLTRQIQQHTPAPQPTCPATNDTGQATEESDQESIRYQAALQAVTDLGPPPTPPADQQ